MHKPAFKVRIKCNHIQSVSDKDKVLIESKETKLHRHLFKCQLTISDKFFEKYLHIKNFILERFSQQN